MALSVFALRDKKVRRARGHSHPGQDPWVTLTPGNLGRVSFGTIYKSIVTRETAGNPGTGICYFPDN